MKLDVITFFALFALASAACAVSSHALFAMAGEVNRKSKGHSRFPLLGFSWLEVWREYRTLYPNGRYAKLLLVAVILAGVLSLMTFYYLFGVLPKYALPSR